MKRHIIACTFELISDLAAPTRDDLAKIVEYQLVNINRLANDEVFRIEEIITLDERDNIIYE